MGMLSKIDEKFDKFDWLAGFFEGDGTIIVHKHFVKKVGRTYKYPTFKLIQKEPAVLEFARDRIIGFGSLNKSNKSCHALSVYGYKRSSLVADHLRNRIRTGGRVKQFNKWAKFFGFRSTKLKKKISLSWLAGFFDAEGWTCVAKPRKFVPTFDRYVTRKYFMVGVSQKDPEILLRIKKVFGGHICNGVKASCSLFITSRLDALHFITTLRPYLRNPSKMRKLEADHMEVLKHRRQRGGYEVAS